MGKGVWTRLDGGGTAQCRMSQRLWPFSVALLEQTQGSGKNRASKPQDTIFPNATAMRSAACLARPDLPAGGHQVAISCPSSQRGPAFHCFAKLVFQGMYREPRRRRRVRLSGLLPDVCWGRQRFALPRITEAVRDVAGSICSFPCDESVGLSGFRRVMPAFRSIQSRSRHRGRLGCRKCGCYPIIFSLSWTRAPHMNR